MRTKLIQSDGFHRIQWLMIRADDACLEPRYIFEY